MKKITFTEDKIKDILEKYQDREYTVAQILEEYSITSNVLSRIVRENGIAFRNQNLCKPRPRKSHGKKCYYCKKNVDLSGAKYCPYCGRNIQAESDIIIDKLTGLFPFGEFIPVNSREEYRITLNKAIEHIRKENKA